MTPKQALKSQIEALAQFLGTTVETESLYDGISRLGDSRTALVQHFKSTVLDRVKVALCPNDFVGRLATEQQELPRRVCQDFTYWYGRSKEKISSRWFLVTWDGWTEIISVSDINSHARMWLEDAPKLTPAEELAKRIEKHDWDYMMSDDSRGWASGSNNWQRIRDLINQVGTRKAKAIWRKCAPKDKVFPTQVSRPK